MNSLPAKKTFDVSKRIVDVVIAVILLIVSSPIQLAVAILVLKKLGRPIFFRQERPGRGGKSFQLMKFRTMLHEDPSINRVTDEERLTGFGKILRSTSLDELPTLVNVVRGEMSIVGPRPLLVRYLDRYTPEQSRRHQVRPGITGLAQVRGRNSLSWEEKFKLDVFYVDNRCFALDFRILVNTVRAVTARHGISAEGNATMPEFMMPPGFGLRNEPPND